MCLAFLERALLRSHLPSYLRPSCNAAHRSPSLRELLNHEKNNGLSVHTLSSDSVPL